MCVIIHALRKKHLARLEVIQAMKHNNSGFFMSHWAHGSTSPEDRTSIRTLNEDEALNFFDETPDENMFVMHARIPSKGIVSVDNVHGWDEDGVMFCHNMTLSSLNGLMDAEGWKGTDSEYFFRNLFMPMHRGEHLADPNLKPGELGPATKRLTSLLCGDTNKFLFVMPDNTVIRAGKWSTVASEKRVTVEEREVDEVIGEEFDIDGKMSKKTQKVVKPITVEREFATVLASNTYYRASTTTTGSSFYTGRKWNPKTRCYESDTPTEGKETKTTGYGGYGGAYGGYGCGYGGYGDDLPFDDPEYYGDGFEDFKKPGKKSSGKGKAKAVEATSDDMAKFMEWRKSIPDFKEPTGLTGNEISTSLLFSNVTYADGKFDGDSLAKIFNLMLRCVIYHNYRENIESILAMDTSAFDGDEDQFGLVVTASDTLLDYAIPSEFDDSLATFVCSVLVRMREKMAVNPSGHTFMLPSEALREALIEFMNEMDYNLGVNLFSASNKDENYLDADKQFFANLSAIDTLINLSFDPTVKANKDVERYARAALVVSRKLKWIPPALILAGDRSMISATGGWEESKNQQEYLEALNFIAEACVSNGASLEGADRKYVSELKNLGFDFDKKGSMEIFIPGVTNAESSSDNTSGSANDGVAIVNAEETSDGEEDKSKSPETADAHEPSVLGDPEKNGKQEEEKK